MTTPEPNPHTPEGNPSGVAQMGRRGFLKLAAFLTAGLTACQPQVQNKLAGRRLVGPESRSDVPTDVQYASVPDTPNEQPSPGVFRVFTPHEALTVVALTARIFPGTPEDPGAREANVVTYIDGMLSYNEGFNQPTYRKPPYAQIYQGERPPRARLGEEGTVWVPADQIFRYGYQSILTPRDVYRVGLDGVDRYAQQRFGQDFIDLTEDQQDEIVGAMADGRAPDFGRYLPAVAFFHNLRRHTMEGMFSDPVYGGNQDFAGWKLIGFPGPQRAYSAADLQTEGTRREIQGFHQLREFNPGRDVNDHVHLPLSSEDVHQNRNR